MTSPVQNAGHLFGGVTAQGSSSESPLGMDAFLKMFLTQLQHQDPNNPMESYELAAQLAQFSTVERLSEVNNNMVKQLSALNSINYSQMVQMVGKDVTGEDDGIQLHEGQVSTSSYDLEVPARVTVKIYNEEGSLVRTLSLGTQESGTYQVQWDGKSDAGQSVVDGKYRVQVEAVNELGNSVSVEQKVSGPVHAFRLVDGVPHLVLDHEKGLCLPIAAVRQVREASSV